MRFDCSDPDARAAGVDAAVSALADGDLVVFPTDTVYGLAADAFSPAAVERLVTAKGRDRTMPPPVLIATSGTLEALAVDVPGWLRSMTAELWPGPLTVICRAQPSLDWDLGDTHGTVAVRVPDDEIARAVLLESGPLAVSSANRTGEPAATSVDDAERMLGESVAIYLDAGPSAVGVASTILDVTAATPRVLRPGPIGLDVLHTFNNTIEALADHA
jgi:tRNA threonylcarbamoyl adenosine modification protein (Sua5/YciO/YrdC/YwlC family)